MLLSRQRRDAAAQHARYHGRRRGGRGQHADESALSQQRVDRGEREVETQSAGDLDEQQSDMERSDAQLAERQLAVGNQQHQENQVGSQKGQRCEKRVENAADDHGDRQHPVFELLQYHMVQVFYHLSALLMFLTGQSNGVLPSIQKAF
jgi:type IV secretory pathway VirB10-like protein